VPEELYAIYGERAAPGSPVSGIDSSPILVAFVGECHSCRTIGCVTVDPWASIQNALWSQDQPASCDWYKCKRICSAPEWETIVKRVERYIRCVKIVTQDPRGGSGGCLRGEIRPGNGARCQNLHPPWAFGIARAARDVKPLC